MSGIAAPLFSEVTEASIATLIDRFYSAIRIHPVLAEVFQATIATDEWPEHLTTMRRFWSSVMLTSGRYSGNPVASHRAVRGLRRSMFAQWLGLFEATATQLFVPEVAGRFAAKAGRIAGSLELAVFHQLGEPPDAPIAHVA